MMQPFRNFSAVGVVMPASNINTDSIIPAVWMRSNEADLGAGLFGRLRYDEGGKERPDFVLNQPPFRQAQVLIGGENFGCGSSREAAVWALVRFGIRCVLAPSFADIFYENSFRNGLLVGLIDPVEVARLDRVVAEHRDNPLFAVDLAGQFVTGPDGKSVAFRIPASRRDALLRGDDDIETTLRHAAEIDSFLVAAQHAKPWLYPSASENGSA